MGFSRVGSPVVFGGEKDDRIGSILELPDGFHRDYRHLCHWPGRGNKNDLY